MADVYLIDRDTQTRTNALFDHSAVSEESDSVLLLPMASPHGTQRNSETNTEDWVLVPDHCPDDTETKPLVKKTPVFSFHLSLELGRAGHIHYTHGHSSHHQHSTNVLDTSPDKSLVVAGQEQSHLFALPSEIRLQIYNHVLCLPYNNGFGVKMTRSPVNRRTPTVLSILSTCRRAFCEAESIFYTSNRLWVDDKNFLSSLGSGRRNAVSALGIPGQSPSLLLGVLKRSNGLPNLRSLHIVRTASIKYMNISSWSILAHQLVAEVEKLPRLEDFQIITPDAEEIALGDVQKKDELGRIYSRLRQAVRHETV